MTALKKHEKTRHLIQNGTRWCAYGQVHAQKTNWKGTSWEEKQATERTHKRRNTQAIPARLDEALSRSKTNIVWPVKVFSALLVVSFVPLASGAI